MRSACSSARPTVSAAMRLRLAIQAVKTAAPTIAVTMAGTTTLTNIGNTRDVLSSGDRVTTWGLLERAPLCRVGRSLNLRKQVEPLIKAALQASSVQRRAHHAASRLTWVIRWLKRAFRHHAQSRELKPCSHLTMPSGPGQANAPV